MADFVAVIRRAVDGLANNTPDMRAKVYDKARGAVQRQLENMKPRPPEDMLRRQMEKLEAAIVEVESEHAEAVDPMEEAAVVAASPDEATVAEEYRDDIRPEAPEDVPAAQAYAVGTADEHAEQEPGTASAPSSEDTFQQPSYEVEPSSPVGTFPPTSEAEPRLEGGAPQAVEEARYTEEPHVYGDDQRVVETDPDQSAPQSYGDWRDDVPPEDERGPPFAYEQPVADPGLQGVADYRAGGDLQGSEPPHETEAPLTASEPIAAEQFAPVPEEDDFPYPGESAPAQPEAPGDADHWRADHADHQGIRSTEEIRSTEDWPAREAFAPVSSGTVPEAGDLAAAWNDVPELVPGGPVEPVRYGQQSAPVEAHFDQATHVAADEVRMPAVSELGGIAAAAAPVAEGAAGDEPLAQDPDEAPKPAYKPADSDPWGDLEELIGFNKDNAASSRASGGGLHGDADADDLMPAPARPYRVTPVKKRNYAGILLAVIGLLVVGTGGYAFWVNRDSLNEMVGGLIPADSSAVQGSEQAAVAETPAEGETPAAVESTPSPQDAQSSPGSQASAPQVPDAAVEPTSGTKFTQRLMPDGSEADEGPAGESDLAQNAEGQSVAQLNAPPANPPAASAPAASGDPAAPGTSAPAASAEAGPAGNAPAASPAEAPALAGEKMFLYEERIGQSAPTAIDGAVSWSLQREAGANGQQEPVIQGRVTVPGRGLTALITVKRNTDSSLPASHLIEIVFAVPPDFEGGAIDSLQRIAMKQTEQDRGNALIAVPAKITDDFHMIALNDFPDARATNLELLRSRNWIDVPVAYRNGRRALFTLQKGPEGERVFNDAIREWGNLGTAATGQ